MGLGARLDGVDRVVRAGRVSLGRSGVREGAHCAFDGRARIELGIDGEPMQEQPVAQCHESPRRRRGVGDADGDHDPFGPPLELASLPSQGFAQLGVVGEGMSDVPWGTADTPQDGSSLPSVPQRCRTSCSGGRRPTPHHWAGVAQVSWRRFPLGMSDGPEQVPGPSVHDHDYLDVCDLDVVGLIAQAADLRKLPIMHLSGHCRATRRTLVGRLRTRRLCRRVRSPGKRGARAWLMTPPSEARSAVQARW